jgi:hypothetical protein
MKPSIMAIAMLTAITCLPAASGAEKLYTVMNPAIENREVERAPLVPRLDSLDGKTLYLVDVQWGGPQAGYSVFEEMQGWFTEHMPGVKTVLRRTKGNIFSDDPELWQEIGEKGDAAIVGIAG